ncbi:MAG: phosphoribosylanthranilate isomerase [Thermodesulfobacteriota bacterium]|nr:phosphoribosylanthranilate isomerase [Thermodesulfobacteriota bacterium]
MTKIKICGITNSEDASWAVDLGADALGFVFYKESPRYVSKEVARDIICNLPPFVSSVGVFVNEHEERINEISEFCSLDLIQLHGNEAPDFCDKFNKRLIKALKIKDGVNLEFISLYNVSAILLDTYYKELYGGGGKTFNWQLASQAKGYAKSVILAGGLNPDNIVNAIQIVKPYGVDVSSGVEHEPGKKSYGRLKKFITIAKEL